MTVTGEIPRDRPLVIAERQKASETQLMRAIRKNDAMFRHLLEDDDAHAKAVVNTLIEQISAFD